MGLVLIGACQRTFLYKTTFPDVPTAPVVSRRATALSVLSSLGTVTATVLPFLLSGVLVVASIACLKSVVLVP